MAMRWIANPNKSGSIPLSLFFFFLNAFGERDGMVDMSDLGSGDDLVVWVQVPPLVVILGVYSG